MKLLKVFVIVCLISSNLFAQIRIDDSFESTTLENQMELFLDTTNRLTIKDILENKSNFNFITSTVSSPSFGYNSGNRWIHFKVKNISSKTLQIFIRIYRTAPDISDFFLCYKNKVIQKESYNWRIPFYLRKTQSKIVSAQFHIETNKVFDIYVLINQKYNTNAYPIHVLSSKTYYRQESYENVFYGILVGVMILAMIMSFFLFSLSKELIYFYYSFYSLCTTLAILSLGGYLTYLFGSKYEILTGPHAYLFYILGFISFNILFTHSLLNIKKEVSNWLYLIGRGIVFFCFSYAIILLYNFKLVLSFKYLYLNVLFGFVLILSILISLIRGNILAKFYFVAFLPIITISSLLTFSELGFIKITNLLPFLAPCLLFEMTVLLIGLAFRLFDYQRKKQQLESEMTFKIIHSQETERQRIAQDLHDEVGNSLAALKNYISQTNLELGEKINKIAQDVRNISHNLASIDFDSTTLLIAFQNLINRHNEAESIDYELIEVGNPHKLAAEKELVIYRIVCELLNNIQKHSKARKATLQLIYEAQNLTIIVEDDGIGIKTKSTVEEGIGLKHIQTRIAYLNAKLTIDDDGKGTIVVIDVPIST